MTPLGQWHPAGGLCSTCRHRRLVESRRGSLFILCRRSETDAGYPRYPRLPVLGCAGFEPVLPGQGEGSGDRPLD